MFFDYKILIFWWICQIVKMCDTNKYEDYKETHMIYLSIENKYLQLHQIEHIITLIP